MVSINCPWCKKETKHIKVITGGNKDYLLR